MSDEAHDALESQYAARYIALCAVAAHFGHKDMITTEFKENRYNRWTCVLCGTVGDYTLDDWVHTIRKHMTGHYDNLPTHVKAAIALTAEDSLRPWENSSLAPWHDELVAYRDGEC